MAPTKAAGGSTPDPAAGGGNAPDSPELWGNGGVVGDGRYRLTRRLGRGGMAEVFAAEDVRLGRVVAIKLLRADLAEDPVAKARFTREAQSVAGLNHHAVVSVYDSGEDVLVNGETVPFIVMEYVEGRTIRDLLVNADAPPVDQALIIVSGVLEALAYSHKRNIVHRDIKPANVIITDTGAVKVMDFGIARALHGAQSTMTQTGMVMGTPQYLSPEQALGRAVDARSDLYSTGCLLYELLALRPPFTGDSPLSVVYQHVQDEPTPPSKVSDRVPPELDGLVLRALAKEPDDRYQSAEEMRGEIQYALRMLSQEGARTGTWATGHFGTVPGSGSAGHSADATTVADLPQAPPDTGTSPQSTPASSTPTQGMPPLLLSPLSPAVGSRRGRKWRKPALVAAAAVLAIGAGIFTAVNVNSNAATERPDKHSPSATTEGGKQGGTLPGAESPQEPGTGEDEETQPGTGGAETPAPAPTWSDNWTSQPSAPPSTRPPTMGDPGQSPPSQGTGGQPPSPSGGSGTADGGGGNGGNGGGDPGGGSGSGGDGGTDAGGATGQNAGGAVTEGLTGS